MKDIRTATIYQIINRKTGEHYIGSTRNRIATRWNYHLDKLNAGIHEVRELQNAWDKADISDWDFRILEAKVPLEKQFDKELEWQHKLSPTFGDETYFHRLIQDKKRETVVNLLKEGKSYREISKQCSISLAWISVIKHRYVDCSVIKKSVQGFEEPTKNEPA